MSVHVSIPSWEFEDRHIVFNITTMPSESETYSTKRRYREFERLNRKLGSRNMPKLSLPGKLLMHSDSAIEGRRNKLERVLKNYVLQYGMNSLLEDFLAPRTGNGLLNSRTSSVQGSVLDDSMSTMTGREFGDDQTDGGASVVGNGEEMSSEDDAADPSLKKTLVVTLKQEYHTWGLEMLAARAGFRAEQEQSYRLAKIYALATLASLLGSVTLKSNRLPFIGAAFGSAFSAGIALLSAIWTKRKEDWRRRGFGLLKSPSACTDAADVRELLEHFDERRSVKEESTEPNVHSTPSTITDGTSSANLETVVAVCNNEGTVTAAAPSIASSTEVDEAILSKIDELHIQSAHGEVIRIIKTTLERHHTHSEVAWRFARAVYYNTMFEKADVAALRLSESLDNLKMSASANGTSLTHKWLAIVSNAYGERKGSIRDRVEAGLAFEYHTKKALELDPTDSSLHYMAGRLCFDLAGLSWLERQGAKAISGKEPPKATYQDALRNYENAMAIRVSPAFQLEIGRCYQKLKENAKALEYFNRAAQFPTEGVVLTPEEDYAIQEAREIVQKLT